MPTSETQERGIQAVSDSNSKAALSYLGRRSKSPEKQPQLIAARSNTFLPPIPQLSRTQTTFFNAGRYNINNRVLRVGLGTSKPHHWQHHLEGQDQHLEEDPQPTQVNMLSPSKPHVASQSAEFATRFAHRPSTRPKVQQLDSETMIPRAQGSKAVSRGIGGFFPPVKLRMAGEHQLPPGHAPRPAKVRCLKI